MKPSIKYFIYIRKSTDDKTGKRQALSLDAQRRELRAIVKREKLAVVGIFEESRTAKEPGRPRFNRMLDRIERGDANGIFAWDIDRLYRNPVDEGRTRWMLQKNIIASIKTPTRSYQHAEEVTRHAADIELAYGGSYSPLAEQWQPLLKKLGIMFVVPNGGWLRGAKVLPNFLPENPPLTAVNALPPEPIFIPQFSIAKQPQENAHEQPRRKRHARARISRRAKNRQTAEAAAHP